MFNQALNASCNVSKIFITISYNVIWSLFQHYCKWKINNSTTLNFKLFVLWMNIFLDKLSTCDLFWRNQSFTIGLWFHFLLNLNNFLCKIWNDNFEQIFNIKTHFNSWRIELSKFKFWETLIESYLSFSKSLFLWCVSLLNRIVGLFVDWRYVSKSLMNNSTFK